MDSHPYTPSFDAEQVERLRAWHDDAYQRLHAMPSRTLDYLGLHLTVPAGVFGPTPTSDLLGRAVLAEVRDADRVLDMGTGTGVNAVLAASRSTDVVGVDVNPDAVAAAIDNAVANGVADRTTFLVGDLFAPVDGTFDLVVIDPPFRWFRPRDMAERAMADEGYEALGRFFAELPRRLRPGGRVLVFFGTSGDLDHLLSLAHAAGFVHEVIETRDLEKDGQVVSYLAMRMTRPDQA
jgi:release factor glutamine methyltransferase